jgi:hypothetical protein
MWSPQSGVKTTRGCEVSNLMKKRKRKTSIVAVTRGDKRQHDAAGELAQKIMSPG